MAKKKASKAKGKTAARERPRSGRAGGRGPGALPNEPKREAAKPPKKAAGARRVPAKAPGRQPVAARSRPHVPVSPRPPAPDGPRFGGAWSGEEEERSGLHEFVEMADAEGLGPEVDLDDEELAEFEEKEPLEGVEEEPEW